MNGYPNVCIYGNEENQSILEKNRFNTFRACLKSVIHLDADFLKA